MELDAPVPNELTTTPTEPDPTKNCIPQQPFRFTTKGR